MKHQALAHNRGVIIRPAKRSNNKPLIMAVLFVVLFVTFISILRSATPPAPIEQAAATVNDIYLIEHAREYTTDVTGFALKALDVSSGIGVPVEWLMSVMHSESSLDASAKNRKGSGATGLIQFMPNTLTEYGITIPQLQNLNHVQQLDFVQAYFEKVATVRNTTYECLTDLYLAVLYPKALENKDNKGYVLYKKPSKQYSQNKGLDYNKDGKVTIADIDKRMSKLYEVAYLTPKQKVVAPASRYSGKWGF